jgi:hypothetical protein
MNLGEINATQSEQSKVVRPEVLLNKKLQQDGLKQASELQQTIVNENQSISDNRKVAARVLGLSISLTLNVEGQTADLSAKDKDDGQKVKAPFFDFEEVARNVLNFVGNVIKKASADDASDEKLYSLFEQARYGVSKGIELAEGELGKSASEEAKEGIVKSRASILDGIQKLETLIFDKSDKSVQAAAIFGSLQKTELSEFSVRTRDGDEVQIRFGLLENTSKESFTSDDSSSQASFIYKQTTNFSLLVKGELDENELQAVADLIAQADDVANIFYRGDIETSYNKALNIGFDKRELSSFVMQLSKIESSQKMQKYSEVQKYSEIPSKDLQAPKAVADYLNKVLDGMNQAAQHLGSKEAFKSVINSLVNEMKDVQIPDILSAINRFHTFNAQLLDNLQINTPSIGPNKKPAE